MNIANLLSFAILAGVLVLIPGLDFAMVLRYATTQFRKSAFLVSAGIASGLYVCGIAAVLGIAALLRTSAAAFNILKIAGAAYLFWMGGRFVLSSFKKNRQTLESILSPTKKPYVKGLMTNLLNPKPAVFYLSIFPQFIPIDSNHLLVGVTLVSIHALETMVFFAALILFVGTLKPFFAKPSVASMMERISGTLIIGFGAKLLLDRAPH